MKSFSKNNVDGILIMEPKKNSSAKFYKKLTYQEALNQGLTVMDNTAFTLCQQEKIPVIVFKRENLEKIEKLFMVKMQKLSFIRISNH